MNHRRAFTLLETLVAVAVLLMALLGPFSIAQQALKSAYYARDQVTAFYLAQEGVEFVRAIRDQNYLSGSAWLTGIDACTDVPCIVDFPNFTYTVCPQGVCPPIRVSQIGGLYNHVTGTDSPFTRYVVLTPSASNPDQMIVSVTISWRSAGVPRVFTIQERLFNWL
jgi:prepilin-type N-terminal cleavage/methylation domain-containing protein